jgi:hypothetical protein
MPIAKVIEVFQLPHGEDIPIGIRTAWIGCRFPTAVAECGHIPVYVWSALEPKGSDPVSAMEWLANPERHRLQKIAGFSVRQDIALPVLAKRAPEAAKWWYDRGFPLKDPERNCFRFKREEVLVVEVHD